eukprot:932288-Pleurochrysis_carterae.AAC.1
MVCIVQHLQNTNGRTPHNASPKRQNHQLVSYKQVRLKSVEQNERWHAARTMNAYSSNCFEGSNSFDTSCLVLPI